MSADLRAAFAAAWDQDTERLIVERVVDAPAPAGFTVWRVGGAMSMAPTLRALTPISVRQRYLARIVSNCVGTCPLCGAVAGILPDSPTPDHPGAWHVMPVLVGVNHSAGCPAIFTEDDRRWVEDAESLEDARNLRRAFYR